MTDIAIHQLPEADPLTGAEIVPIDDGTATVRTTVAELRRDLAPLAAPAFTGPVTVNGSSVVVTDAAGVLTLSPGRLDVTGVVDETVSGARFSAAGSARFHQISAVGDTLVVDRHADGDKLRVLSFDADGRARLAVAPSVAGTAVSLDGHVHTRGNEVFDAVLAILREGNGVALDPDATTGTITVATTGGGAAVSESAPIYLTSGSSTTITGSAVLGVAERVAGATFSIPYTSEGDYIQEDAANGTDQSGGTFTLRAAAGSAVDFQTALLLRGDGASGSSTITDSGYNGVAVASTGVTISTAQMKFGTGSLCFNGSSYLSIADGAVPEFAAQNWAIDFHIYIPQTPTGYPSIAVKNNGASKSWQIYYDSSGYIHFEYSTDGTTMLSGLTTTASLTAGAWTHVAVARSGTTVRAYMAGALAGTCAVSGSLFDAAAPVIIGGYYTTALSYPLTGYLDEFRVSVGTDRGWTGSTIAVPTSPYGIAYPLTPYYVTTTDASRIDASAFETIDDATVTATLPTGTAIRYAVSFDGRATWKTWLSSAWATIALNSAAILASGMDATTLRTALLTWTPSLGTKIDIAAVLSTTDASATPVLDEIGVIAGEWSLLTPGADYTAKWKKTGTERAITLTRLKAGAAHHLVSTT